MPRFSRSSPRCTNQSTESRKPWRFALFFAATGKRADSESAPSRNAWRSHCATGGHSRGAQARRTSARVAARGSAVIQLLPKRTAARCFARSASTARSRGGALVASEWSSTRATEAVSSTARLKAFSFSCEGRLKPVSLRTNWSDAARISSSVTGGSKLNSVLMLRHMPPWYTCVRETDRALDRPTDMRARPGGRRARGRARGGGARPAGRRGPLHHQGYPGRLLGPRARGASRGGDPLDRGGPVLLRG